MKAPKPKAIVSGLLFTLIFELMGGLLYGVLSNWVLPEGWERSLDDVWFSKCARAIGFYVGLGHIMMLVSAIAGFCFVYNRQVRRDALRMG